MAAPLTADQFLAVLRAEGVKVVEVSGWRTRNRNHKGAWGPVHGVMLHHTVTGPKVNAVPICRDGFAALPGPLCHGVIRRDGTVHLVGHGRANHAGTGDPRVLEAVIAEDYGGKPPAPRFHDGSQGGADGNARFYGFECENLGDGEDPWPPAQVEAMVRVSAALSRAHGWSDKSVIGHLEWSDWKSDPKGPIGVKGSDSVVMPDIRRRVAERLNHDASWSRGTAPKPPAPPAPRPGGTVTLPNLSHLIRSTDLNLLSGSPTTLYWETEHADEPNQHGDGGFNFLSNADYTATLHLSLVGVSRDSYVEVRPIVTPIGGGTAVEGPAIQVDGRGASGDPGEIVRGLTFTGNVQSGHQLGFRATYEGPGTAVLTFGRVSCLSWPQ